MTGINNKYEIFILSKRIQHFLFFLCFTMSFLTGASFHSANNFLLASAEKLLGSRDMIYQWHALFGLATSAVLLSHILYLAIRSYIESIPLKAFPLLFNFKDLKGLISSPANLILGKPEKSIRYTPLRKALYWIFLFGGITITSSGCSVYFWDRIDSSLISSNIGLLSSIHAGTSFIMAIFIIWHIYDIVAGGRRLSFLLLAFNGKITSKNLEEYYPEEYRLIKEEEQKVKKKWDKIDVEKLKDDEHSEERKMIEKLLERGNLLAEEGLYMESAAEYRKALNEFPVYSQAQYNLAIVLEKAGRIEDALAAYQRFMEIDPFHPLAQEVSKAIIRLQEQG